VVVSVALMGCLSLQLRSWLKTEELKGQNDHWDSLQKSNKALIDNLKQTKDVEGRLDALNALATNRFLWASVLNSLQACMVDGIELVRLKGDHAYTPIIKEPPAKASQTRKPTGGMTNIMEKIALTLEARDYGGERGGLFSRFQENIANEAYLKTQLTNGTVKLLQLSPPLADQESTNRNYVLFTIECQFAPKTR
jgi:hypothetical protein